MDIGEDRHRCEVRALLVWRQENGRQFVDEWIAAVEKSRGKAAADKLVSDAKRQWSKGNRGKPSDWRD